MKDIFWWEPKISKHKAVCFQLSWMENELGLGCDFKITWHESHSGFNFELRILGLWFNINFYDIRHWDDENNRWVIYEEDEHE
jgi:hypothetical protein